MLGQLLEEDLAFLRVKCHILILVPLVIKMVVNLVDERALEWFVSIHHLQRAQELGDLLALVESFVHLVEGFQDLDVIAEDVREYRNSKQEQPRTQQSLLIVLGVEVSKANCAQRGEREVHDNDGLLEVRPVQQFELFHEVVDHELVRVELLYFVDNFTENDPDDTEEEADVQNHDDQLDALQ